MYVSSHLLSVMFISMSPRSLQSYQRYATHIVSNVLLPARDPRTVRTVAHVTTTAQVAFAARYRYDCNTRTGILREDASFQGVAVERRGDYRNQTLLWSDDEASSDYSIHWQVLTSW